jgi:hypothetical protein
MNVVWARIDQTKPEGARLAKRFHSRGSTPTYIAVSHDGTSAYYNCSGALSLDGFLHNMTLLLFSQEQYERVLDSIKSLKAAEAGGRGSQLDMAEPKPEELLTLAKGHLMAGGSGLEQARSELEQIVRIDETNQSGVVDDAMVLLSQMENASGSQHGPAIAVGYWIKIMRRFPTSDRAPDAVLYLAKSMRSSGQDDVVKKLVPFLKTYPAGVDAAGALKAVEGK